MLLQINFKLQANFLTWLNLSFHIYVQSGWCFHLFKDVSLIPYYWNWDKGQKTGRGGGLVLCMHTCTWTHTHEHTHTLAHTIQRCLQPQGTTSNRITTSLLVLLLYFSSTGDAIIDEEHTLGEFITYIASNAKPALSASINFHFPC